MMMMEGIFASHPSLAVPPLNYALLALASLALAQLTLTLLSFAPLHSPVPCSTHPSTLALAELKW